MDEDKIKMKALKSYGDLNKGDIFFCNRRLAGILVEHGYATRIDDKFISGECGCVIDVFNAFVEFFALFSLSFLLLLPVLDAFAFNVKETYFTPVLLSFFAGYMFAAIIAMYVTGIMEKEAD